ncbi:MAG: glycosyltransferase [Actinomycetia bacterium]|nr:glycosyltransferase [Actinomycetes bacterium]
MRSRLRLFVLVGALATAVDVGTVLVLQSWPLLLADAVALVAAAGLAYSLNRTLTFRAQPTARWVRRPLAFATTALVAGLVDVGVLALLHRLGMVLVLAKVGAVLAAATIRWIAYRRILFNEVRRDLAQRLIRPPSVGKLRLSVIIPAYEEETLIGGTIEAVRGGLGKALESDDFELIVVDDGSPDRTSDIAGAAGARVVPMETNQGKGAAVRAGVAAAEGRTVVFTDADLAYPPHLIVDVMEQVEQGWDVVVGSRRHDDTNTLVRARRVRELGGRAISLLTQIVLLGNFRDTQCGLKGFRGDIAKTIFARSRIDGFAFDVEIFLIAEQDRLSLTEIPVAVTNRSGSSVRIVGDTIGLLVDLFRIRRWAGGGRYRPSSAQAAVLAAGQSRDQTP